MEIKKDAASVAAEFNVAIGELNKERARLMAALASLRARENAMMAKIKTLPVSVALRLHDLEIEDAAFAADHPLIDAAIKMTAGALLFAVIQLFF